jgi:hypothetical protein
MAEGNKLYTATFSYNIEVSASNPTEAEQKAIEARKALRPRAIVDMTKITVK